MKILFLLKENGIYGNYAETSKSGLLNSAKFLLDALLRSHVISQGKIEICRDGNSIDRFVHQYQPDLCIIEAIWVTPEKLAENERLHPYTIFIVRVHSNIPFLAMEGVAIDWMKKYKYVALNSRETTKYLTGILVSPFYLPNIDEAREHIHHKKQNRSFVNIASFGAIRPLKNQLIQAVAAINYGNNNDTPIHFHINASRVEQGESAIKNIRSLFKRSRHTLVEHAWLTHDRFLDVVRSMDVGMQISFSESFNIVSADFVQCGVPIIVSPDISWMYSGLMVNPNDASAIESKIYGVINRREHYIRKQTASLARYNKGALKTWREFLC